MDVTVAYKLTSDYSNLNGYTGSCGITEASSGPGFPFPVTLRCDPPYLYNDTRSPSGTSTDMSESDVDALVSQLSAQRPTYVMDFSGDGAFSSCDVFLDPSGRTTKAQGYSDKTCGTLSVVASQ